MIKMIKWRINKKDKIENLLYSWSGYGNNLDKSPAITYSRGFYKFTS